MMTAMLTGLKSLWVPARVTPIANRSIATTMASPIKSRVFPGWLASLAPKVTRVMTVPRVLPVRRVIRATRATKAIRVIPAKRAQVGA